MRLFLLLAVSAALAGCGEGDVKRNPLMVKADRYRAEGEPQLAEKFYRELMERKPDSGAARLALATLYDENLDDPAAAFYLYGEFLRLEPDSPDRAAVEGYRRMAAAKLRRRLEREALPVPPADSLEALQQENDSLRRQLEAQKRYMLDQKRRLDALTAASEAGRAAPVAGERTYTVRAGDTPGKIALKFYGTATKYRRILEANNLTGSAGLRIGQELKIPAAD